MWLKARITLPLFPPDSAKAAATAAYAGAGIHRSPLDLLDVGLEFLGFGFVPELFLDLVGLLALGAETIPNSDASILFLVHLCHAGSLRFLKWT